MCFKFRSGRLRTWGVMADATLRCNETAFRVEFEKSSDGDETDTVCLVDVQGPCGRRVPPSGLV